MLLVKETHLIAGPTEFRNQQKIVPRVPPKTMGLAALLGANHSPPTATFSSKSHTTSFCSWFKAEVTTLRTDLYPWHAP